MPSCHPADPLAPIFWVIATASCPHPKTGSSAPLSLVEFLALFGCHRTRPLEHFGSAGLLWAINGGTLVQLHRDWALIEGPGNRAQHAHHRRVVPAGTSRCLGSGLVQRPTAEYALHRCPCALRAVADGPPMGPVARRPSTTWPEFGHRFLDLQTIGDLLSATARRRRGSPMADTSRRGQICLFFFGSS